NLLIDGAAEHGSRGSRGGGDRAKRSSARRVVLVRPLPVAFHAPHDRASLIVEADLAAEQSAFRIDAVARERAEVGRPAGRHSYERLGIVVRAGAVAAVDADIEAGPAPQRRRRIRRLDREIRRRRNAAKRGQRDAGQQKLFHVNALHSRPMRSPPGLAAKLPYFGGGGRDICATANEKTFVGYLLSAHTRFRVIRRTQ